MRSKLTLLIAGFFFVSMGIGFMNAKHNELSWDDFEQRFKEKLESATSKKMFIPQMEKKEKLVEIKKDEYKKEESISSKSTDPINHLSQEIKSSHLYEQMIDFRIDELNLVKNAIDKVELAQKTSLMIEQLEKCLRSEQCLERPNADNVYYHQGHTRAHQLLERALHTAILLIESDVHLSDFFPLDVNLSLLDIDNNEIQILALELSTSSELNDKRFSELMKKSSVLNDEARALLFSQTERFTRSSEQKRSIYMQRLKDEMNRDAASALEILKYLQFVELSKSETVEVTQSLCSHQENSQSHNWKAIVFQHEQYQSSNGTAPNLKNICQ